MGRGAERGGVVGRGRGRVRYRPKTSVGQSGWALDYSDDSGRHQPWATNDDDSLCITRDEAESAAWRRHEQILTGASPGFRRSMTIGEFVRSPEFDDYMTVRAPKPATLRRMLASLRQIEESGYSERTIDEARQRSSVTAHIAARKKAGVSNGTINNELSLVRLIMSALEDGGHIDQAPRIQQLRYSTPLKRILTHAEIRNLLDAARSDEDPQAYPLVALWTYAGLRQQEGARCRRGWIDPSYGLLSVHSTKTAHHSGANELVEPVPIVRPLDEILRTYIGSLPPVQDELFCGMSPDRCRMMWARVWDRSGNSGWATPHNLRHSVGQMLTAMGVPTRIVMMVLRHRSMRVSLGYQRVEIEVTRDYLQARSDRLDPPQNIVEMGDFATTPQPSKNVG